MSWATALAKSFRPLRSLLRTGKDAQPSPKATPEAVREALRGVDFRAANALADQVLELPGRKEASNDREMQQVCNAMLDLADAAKLANASPTGPFIRERLMPLYAAHAARLPPFRAATLARRLEATGMLEAAQRLREQRGAGGNDHASDTAPDAVDIVRMLSQRLGYVSPKVVNHMFGMLTETRGLFEDAVDYVTKDSAAWPATPETAGAAHFDAVRGLKNAARLATYQASSKRPIAPDRDVRSSLFVRQLLRHVLSSTQSFRGSHHVVLIRSAAQMLTRCNWDLPPDELNAPLALESQDAVAGGADGAAWETPLAATPADVRADLELVATESARWLVTKAKQRVDAADGASVSVALRAADIDTQAQSVARAVHSAWRLLPALGAVAEDLLVLFVHVIKEELAEWRNLQPPALKKSTRDAEGAARAFPLQSVAVLDLAAFTVASQHVLDDGAEASARVARSVRASVRDMNRACGQCLPALLATANTASDMRLCLLAAAVWVRQAGATHATADACVRIIMARLNKTSSSDAHATDVIGAACEFLAVLADACAQSGVPQPDGATDRVSRLLSLLCDRCAPEGSSGAPKAAVGADEDPKDIRTRMLVQLKFTARAVTSLIPMAEHSHVSGQVLKLAEALRDGVANLPPAPTPTGAVDDSGDDTAVRYFYADVLTALNTVNLHLGGGVARTATALVLPPEEDDAEPAVGQPWGSTPLACIGRALVRTLESAGPQHPPWRGEAGSDHNEDEKHTEAFRAAATFALMGDGAASEEVSAAVVALHSRAQTAALRTKVITASARSRATCVRYIKGVCTVEHAAAMGRLRRSGSGARLPPAEPNSFVALAGPAGTEVLVDHLLQSGCGGAGAATATAAVESSIEALGPQRSLHRVVTTLPFVIGSCDGALGADISGRALTEILQTHRPSDATSGGPTEALLANGSPTS